MGGLPILPPPLVKCKYLFSAVTITTKIKRYDPCKPPFGCWLYVPSSKLSRLGHAFNPVTTLAGFLQQLEAKNGRLEKLAS